MAVSSFYDDFNRADNTDPDVHIDWTENGNVEISGNYLRNIATNPTKTYTIYDGTLGSANYSVEGKIKSTGTTGHYGGVLDRWTNSSNFYVAYISWDDGLIYLVKNVATVLTTLQSVGRTFTTNTEYKLKLICNDSNLQVYFENETIPLINITDTSHASGSTGLYGDSTATTSIYWDNFNVKQIYGTTFLDTNFTYKSKNSWKSEGNAQTSTTNKHLILEYPIILNSSEDITFYAMPTNTWATKPTTYVDGTTPSGLWTEIEYRTNSADPSEVTKRYSYQETQQALIADEWTPIKISSSNYGLSVAGSKATIRVYLAYGEASKYLYIDATPDITDLYFDSELVG